MHGIITSPFDEALTHEDDQDGRVLTPVQYCGLTLKAKLKFDLLASVMPRILKTKKKRPAIAEAAHFLTQNGLKISAPRLAHVYYAYLRDGEPALVDHNLCGGRCGLPGCNVARASAVRQETLDFWQSKAERNDKRALADSWKELMVRLADGEEIPGVGTWHDLYAQTYPEKRCPQNCPWSVHNPPLGWSLTNFMTQRRRKVTKAEALLAQKGFAAAENELTKVLSVQSDTSSLRFMERVVFDDHRLDFKCWVNVEYNGRVISQIVELWGLFAMDLATRTILGFGLRPRIKREDGTRESVTRRDMQHLIAGILRNHGYPKKYRCTLVVENAAAAVTTEFENLLNRLTEGQVIVKRTAVGEGYSTPESYGESWGKPRGKRWLEVWFDALEIKIGDVEGQMGAKWEVQRGDFKQREKYALRLAEAGILSTMPEAAQPFPSLERAIAFVHRGIHELHNRDQHRLQGFDQVKLWRFSEHDPEWKHVDHPHFTVLPLEAQNALMRDTGVTGLVRPETPAERKKRLFHKAEFQRVSEVTFAEMYLDIFRAKYKGHDCISVAPGKKLPAIEFYGQAHKCKIGDTVLCRLNLDHPTHVWLQDEQGRVIGVMQARHRAAVDNPEAHAEQLAQRQRALSAMTRNVKLRHHNPEKLAALEQTIQMLEAITPEDEAETSSESAKLLQSVHDSYSDDDLDVADLYLESHGEE